MQPVNPYREAEVSIGGKTYRLRFGVRELARAERATGIRAIGKQGIQAILESLLDGSLGNKLFLFYLMLGKHQPDLTQADADDLFEQNPDGAAGAVEEVLGLSTPEPDPKVTPAAPTTEPTSPTETSTGS